MPTIYLPKNESVFRCKVGYALAKSGKRVRREFRLGKDELTATKKAIVLAERWLNYERRYQTTSDQIAVMLPDEPQTLPVWPADSGLEDLLAEEASVEQYLAIPPEDLPGDELPVSVRSTVTIKIAVTRFLDRYKNKASRDARAHASYWWYEREFRLGLVPGAIDPNLGVNEVTLATVEKYCDFWCDLSARAAESKRKSFAWRSAHNRLDAFQFLLRDLKGREPGFVYPERADATIHDNKKSIATHMTVIQAYDPAAIRAVLAKGDDRLPDGSSSDQRRSPHPNRAEDRRGRGRVVHRQPGVEEGGG